MRALFLGLFFTLAFATASLADGRAFPPDDCSVASPFMAFTGIDGSNTFCNSGQDVLTNAIPNCAAGQVVGLATIGATGVWHAFLWADGVMTDLGTLGGLRSAAYAINDAGQVVGHANTADGADHAFLWQDGRMTDLGTLGGRTSAGDTSDLLIWSSATNQWQLSAALGGAPAVRERAA